MEDASTESSGRSRRVKDDKFGRLAALQKLKSLKGTKHKYEVVEEAPVYEEVSEKEYSRLIQKRQEEDWIVDDNGIGYVEDGREIFDDDIEDNIYTDQKNKQPNKKNLSGPQKKTAKCSDIKNMFKAIPVKRKIENDVKLDEDDILGSIMEDLHKEAAISHVTPKPMVLTKKHKLNHHSPVQRYQVNPFKSKSPLAADFVPRCTDDIKHSPPVSNRKPLQPKIVDFDNAEKDPIETEHIPTKSLNGSEAKNEVIEEFTEENDDFRFDPSGDIFEDVESFPHVEEESTLPSSKEDCTPTQPSFQGSFSSDTKENMIVDIQVDSEHLPLVTNADGEQVLRFFWLDAYEDQYKQPGTVYLFGKIYLEDARAYTSCCVIVKDVPRRVFFLPRETHFDMKTKVLTDKPVTMPDVYSEVNALLEKMKISEFRSKKSSKNYAFGSSEIPDVCEYLEVQYSFSFEVEPTHELVCFDYMQAAGLERVAVLDFGGLHAKYPPLPSTLNGSTFSHVLGVDSSSTELLLLDQKIKGPCWIDVHAPQLSIPPVSWCKIEVFVTKVRSIICTTESLSIPPVVLLCLNLTTAVNAKTQQNEIVAVSCLSHHQFPLDKTAPLPKYQNHFCVLTKPSDCIFPYDFKDAITNYKNTKVERVDTERSLLIYFLAKLHKMDPDVIVGHDVLGFDLDVLLHRLSVHKIPNWSRIGRLKRTGMPRLNIAQSGIAERNATCGRLLCDIKISSKELIRCKSYDLEELAKYLLNHQFCEIPPECVRDQYMTSKHLIELIDFSMRRAELIQNLNCELNILPLALQITNIAGCIMSRTLLGGRSERNEYLLLHAFHAKNFICPPKVQGKKTTKNEMDGDDDLEAVGKKGRRKPAYEGGLVLDPKKGFYDKFILLMDFNSLYPSIIQEYNICFTTIPRVPNSESKSEGDTEIHLPDQGLDTGILPAEIRKLVESRRQVKQMMKGNDVTKDKYAQYDIRQRALKLTANSMYGCLGFTFSRFYAKPLAALITRKGREILMKTKELVERMGLDVIYGDTDSIMINTNQIDLNEVTQLGNKVKAEINKLYRLLEIDIDGVYKPMLLLKKKKYAALSVSRSSDGKITAKEEIKGLDIVRRDWSQLAKDAGQFIIKEILSNKSTDEIVENIHSHLMNLGTAVKEGRKPLSDYIIYKQLTKNPEEYGNKKNLPHVMVASRVNDKGGKKLKMGDTVAYIICTDGTDMAATQRAYHPDELKSQEDLKIDVFYYLAQQIHPVVSRLCEPIEGTDAALIAQFLGLDASKYHVVVREAEDEEDKLMNPSSLFDDKDRFKNCDKLKLKCPSDNCDNEIIIDDTFKIEPSVIKCQLDSCLKCKTQLVNHATALSNQLQKTMKFYISKYYKHCLICEDVGCAYQTRKMPLQFNSGGPICPSCKNSNLHLEYTEASLYNQLAYFQRMFDIEKAKSTLAKEEEGRVSVPSDADTCYQFLKTTVNKILHRSGYGVVDLSGLFQCLFERNLSSTERST